MSYSSNVAYIRQFLIIFKANVYNKPDIFLRDEGRIYKNKSKFKLLQLVPIDTERHVDSSLLQLYLGDSSIVIELIHAY